MKKRFLIGLCCVLLVFSSVSVYAEGEGVQITGITKNTVVEDPNGDIMGNVTSIEYNNNVYYSLTDMAKLFGYNYIWDRFSNQVNIGVSETPQMQDGEEIPTFGLDKEIFNFEMSISAKGAAVIEDSKDRLLYSKNAYTKLYPASTTKVMTALLALEKGNLTDMVTVGKAVNDLPGDSRRVFIVPGDKLTLEQLLYGLMLHSGNDCAVAIAEHIGGSVEGFADMMNEKAREIGALNTHFTNPHGYHHPEHYTTPRDLAVILLEASKNETFRKIVNTGYYTARYKSKSGSTRTKQWSNTNRFARDIQGYHIDGMIGGKTGFTSLAGCCLVNVTYYNGHTYVCSILKDSSNERYYNTKKLIKKAYALRKDMDSKISQSLQISEIKPVIMLNGKSIVLEENTFTYDGEIYTTYDKIVELFGGDRVSKLDDDIKVYFNNKRMTYYRLQPIIYKNELLLPINEIVDDINYTLSWDAEKQELVLSNEANTMRLPLKTDMVNINGQDQEIAKKLLLDSDIYVSKDLIEKYTPNKIDYTIDTVFSLPSGAVNIVPIMVIGDSVPVVDSEENTQEATENPEEEVEVVDSEETTDDEAKENEDNNKDK